MTDKSTPQRTLDRKKREAEALKANVKKRKEQAQKPLPRNDNPEDDVNGSP